MSLTITIPGAVVATTGATAPATLTIGVGTPGATGPQGPAGAGVPAGGTAGQFLTKIDGTNYNTDWTTVNLSAYAPLASPAFTGNPTAPTAALADNDTSIATTAFVQQELASGTAIAKSIEVNVRNQTGSTLAAGTIVYINGATGNRPTVTPAQANNDANSAQTFGFVKSSIANNGFGQVIVRGEVENLDTSALTEGQQLYLSPTTAGTWTTTKPYAPDHLVYVGIVVRSHPTQGVILAAIQNGYELNEIHDVAISSVADGDLLSYESSTTLWKNKSFSTLGLATQSWVTSQGYLTSSSLSGYAQLSSATFTGEVTVPASTTTTAGLTLPHGVAPTTPVNGEIWTTTGGLFYRINGTTVSPATLAGGTFTGLVSTPASTTASAGFRIVQGVAPTTPTNGDMWQDGTNLNVRIGGATQVIPALGTANTFTGTNTFNGQISAVGSPISLGGGSIAMNVSLAAGLTPSGSTKTVNIGNNSVAGSTTNITIGSTAGTSTTTLQGTTNGVTAAADTNSVAIATTAYVVGQAGSATPLVNGTAAVGTSLRYARQDHIHPTDTSRAPLASPSLTGVPLSTTAAADTNTTQIATTAFVIGQASASTPLADGTAAIGTSLKYARADHVHPTDTSRAPLASPSLTGTPLAPTAAVDTNTTQIATTAYVVGQGYAKLASPSLTGTPAAPTATAGTNTTQIATTAFVTAAVPSFATTAEIASPSSATKVVAPNDVVRMIVNRASFDTQNSSPTFATSGTGATAYKMTNDRSMQIGTPSVGVAGYGQMIYDTTAGAWGVLGAKRGDNFFTQDWNKRIWMSGTHMFTSIGDANTTAYCMLGGRSSITTGNPTKQAIGWKLVGGGTALKLVTYGYNGTGLVVTETTSSFTPVANQSFDWMIVHAPNVANPATSYCYLYVNDALVATGIYSPADATINYNYFYHSFESTASMATRLDAIVFPVKVWWSKS